MELLDEFFAELALHQPWPGCTLALALRETLVRPDHGSVALLGLVGDGLALLFGGDWGGTDFGEYEANARDGAALLDRLPFKAERGVGLDVLFGLFEDATAEGGEVHPVGLRHIELLVQALDRQRDFGLVRPRFEDLKHALRVNRWEQEKFEKVVLCKLLF